MKAIGLILLILLASGSTAGAHLPAGTLVDLTHPFDAETVFWPTAKGFVLEKEFEGVTDKGYYYAANSFCTAEHGGTHIDAPLHFHRGGLAVDALPLEQLIAPGIVVDVSAQARADRDYRVEVADFLGWEKAYGRVPAGAIVLLRTGFGAFWPDRERYMGTRARDAAAVSELHFPGLHPDAARWLVDERRIAAVGLDTPSIDHGPSKLFESHVVLSARNVPAFENVANLDRLPATGMTVIALPMKIRNGSGGPLRIVAIVNPPAAR